MQTRAKLLKLVKDGEGGAPRWQELGTGQLRVNRPKAGDAGDASSAPRHPRLILRREGVFKLLLNALFTSSTKFERATDKSVRFVCESHTEDSSGLGVFVLKFARSDDCGAFLQAVQKAV